MRIRDYIALEAFIADKGFFYTRDNGKAVKFRECSGVLDKYIFFTLNNAIGALIFCSAKFLSISTPSISGMLMSSRISAALLSRLLWSALLPLLYPINLQGVWLATSSCSWVSISSLSSIAMIRACYLP